MFRALSKGSTVAAALAQRQVLATQTRVHAAATVASFHSSSFWNNNNSSSNKTSGDTELSDIFATIRSNSSNSGDNINTGKTSKLLNSSRSSAGTTGAARSGTSFFGLGAPKANTTSNPIHLDTNHATEGRSFKVNSPAMIDQTYRRLRTALNQSNVKRELRLRRTYETGHVRMRREKQERNKKLFGAMVRKKIELIKLMKIRGM
ncbi:hypothetical protein BC939DRAFT_528971 [Gamsiella multidivaricata]|uniref:uncharacterized protein n=1 Tax=Gamsiella multidivaricata TaxID=101098 RepID=UPI00221EDFC5|nr:uncharacterized protein BC939DRAFT_528971 [Gamsiella multidivaricata]KAG0369019.1 hypothetical protein BGZ54_000590 [Gamsiella multidivaricata]KAI7823287.1 hypothetical protein BC939DRAFT_528971 [Gamsiella multidivaricata]